MSNPTTWQDGLRQAGRVVMAATAAAILLLALVQVPGGQAAGTPETSSPTLLASTRA